MKSYKATLTSVKECLLEGNLQFPRHSNISYEGCNFKGPKSWKEAEKDLDSKEFFKFLKEFNLYN